MRTLSTARILLISLGVVVIAAFLPLGVSGYILGLLTVAYYFGVFAMSWDLLFGFAGEVNFGPTFLIGLGAFTAGILNSRYGLPIPACVIAAAAAGLTDVIIPSDNEPDLEDLPTSARDKLRIHLVRHASEALELTLP